MFTVRSQKSERRSGMVEKITNTLVRSSRQLACYVEERAGLTIFYPCPWGMYLGDRRGTGQRARSQIEHQDSVKATKFRRIEC